MMRSAFTQAKWAPPRLARVFERSRLFAWLDAQAKSPAIWVGAAPGAGKSTLVSTWLEARGTPHHWWQLEPSDADPATFTLGLAAALSRGAEQGTMPPLTVDDLADIRGTLKRRMVQHFKQWPPPWTLVLDNAQSIAAESVLWPAIMALLDELPEGVQWILISREPPPGAAARALAHQALVVLDPLDMRLDEEETLSLLALHGRPTTLAPALAVADGWAGGMTLMIVATPKSARQPGRQARERLMDYFAEEVLDAMQPKAQAALMRLAFLPSITLDKALPLVHWNGVWPLLDRLAASSLFTDRRDGEEPSYVFHALFADFLQRRLRVMEGEAAYTEAARAAAHLLATQGELDAAFERWAEVQAWPELAAALRDHAPGFEQRGRLAAWCRVFDRLPPGLPCAVTQGLSYWRGSACIETDPTLAYQWLQRAHQEASDLQDPLGQLMAAAAAALALVAGHRMTELDAWIDVLDQHTKLALAKHSEDVEKRLVPGLLTALVHRRPWHPLTATLAERAERLMTPMGPLVLHLLWSGQVERLQHLVRRLDAIGANATQAAPGTLMRWWNIGTLVKTLLGEHEAARIDADAALELSAREPAVHSQRAQAALVRMIIDLACRDADAARRHLALADAALRPESAVDRAVSDHQRGMLAMLDNDRPTALRLMSASVHNARQSGVPMREHIALIGHALAAAHAHDHALAQTVLEQVFAHPFYAVCRWHHWVAGTVAAYAAWCRRDEPACLQALQVALKAARDHGFRHGPMLFACGDMMARVCDLALAHGIEPDVALDVIKRNALPPPQGASAAWPWPIRVRCFGGLQVDRRDGQDAPSRKESRRLLELLALVAAAGARGAALDTVADALWPDADGDAARNALDNAVHRLRKWLGGDSRLRLRHGVLQLDPSQCWTDVTALEEALFELEQATSLQAMARPMRAIEALVAEPLLPGLTPEAWCLTARKAWHLRVARALQHAQARWRDLPSLASEPNPGLGAQLARQVQQALELQQHHASQV